MTSRNETPKKYITENSDEFKALVDAISDLRKAIAAYRIDLNKRKAELIEDIRRLHVLNARL